MRNIFVALLLAAGVLWNACKNEKDKQAKESTKIASADNQDASAAGKNIKEISHSFANINAQAASEFALNNK